MTTCTPRAEVDRLHVVAEIRKGGIWNLLQL